MMKEQINNVEFKPEDQRTKHVKNNVVVLIIL